MEFDTSPPYFLKKEWALRFHRRWHNLQPYRARLTLPRPSGHRLKLVCVCVVLVYVWSIGVCLGLWTIWSGAGPPMKSRRDTLMPLAGTLEVGRWQWERLRIYKETVRTGLVAGQRFFFFNKRSASTLSIMEFWISNEDFCFLTTGYGLRAHSIILRIICGH